ncbi:MAG: type II toxin-antitoxin system RelE/ParE family toxin [Sulfuricellaceae bacterium]
MDVKWTKRGLESLDNIATYIALGNPRAARDFVAAIQEKSAVLAQHPAIGRVGRLVANTREMVVHKNYVMIYRVKADTVQILRIHHVAQQAV